MKSLLVIILLLGLAACRPTTEFAYATPSTPVADLPIALRVQTSAITTPTAIPQAIIAEADAEYSLLSNIYARIAPSVVNIEVQLKASTLYPAGDIARGSGFVYDSIGHIITNAHVINDAANVRVTFQDGYSVAADILGLDTYSDIGVLRVTTTREILQPLTLANSDGAKVGQRAITIGNPFGLSSSMSVGIISGIGRTLRSAELIDADALVGFQNPSIIQIDAPINPGSSGGPLLNSFGEVVGVTTAIRSDSGVFEGVGFAVPANTVARVVPQLIANGRVEYPWLGISVTPEENGFGIAGLWETLNLPVQSGVLVRGITLGSPADDAGIRGGNEVIEVRGQPVCIGGDIIVAVNDRYVSGMADLVAWLIENTQIGDQVTLRVVRDQQTFDVQMTIRARPANTVTVRDCVR